MRILLRCSLFTALLLALALPAVAHGYIVRSIPQDRAVLERPPVRVQYWFSEDLEPEFSSLILRDQTGAVLASGSVSPENAALMSLRVPPGLADGAYIVELRPAFASDGHVTAESRVFFVGESVSGVAGSSSYEVMPLEIVWRTMLLASTLLLFGAFALYSIILVPAWGSKAYSAGLLPPRVMSGLNRIMVGALIVAFAGNALALLQQSMAFFGTGAGEVLSQGLWNVVRIGSRFGDVWNVRMLLLILVAALHALSLYLRNRNLYPDLIRPIWAGNVWVMALVIGTFSVTSHAAGSLLWPWVAVLVDWLHGVAVSLWVGGLAALVLILPVALRPYTGEARRLALLAALRRFSRLAVGAAAVVIASGVYSSLNWLYEPADLTQSVWGGALIVKLILVAGLLALGLAHHVAARPEQYRHWAGQLGGVGRLVVTLRLEVLIALGVLAAVGNLSASPVPKFLEQSSPAPNAIQTVGDLTIDVTLTPGGTGVNTFDVVVDGEAQGVEVRIVNPAKDRRSAWYAAEAVDNELFVTAAGDINEPGRWLTLVDVTTPNSAAPVRAAFAWDITSDAIPSRSPGLLNVAALVGVLAASVWAILPALRRFYHWLDWNPASVAAAGAALAVTVGLILLGYIVVQRGQAEYEATINPPPKLVNPIVPDADSLAQGESLFAASCAWRSQRREMNLLRERLPRLRDEEIFALTQEGWQGLPPCDSSLRDEQRWHIVNYLRTLENS